MESKGKVEVEDMLAMMEVLSLCDTNGDDRLSLAEAKICEVCLGHTNTNKIKDWDLVQKAALAINIKILGLVTPMLTKVDNLDIPSKQD